MMSFIRLPMNIWRILLDRRKNFRLRLPPTTTIDRGNVAIFMREKV